MAKEFKIYGLRLRGTNEFRYIGCTYKELFKRLSEHFRNKKHNLEKVKWLNDNKTNVEIVFIDGAFSEQNEVFKSEIYWIKFYRRLGHRLLNKTDGGEGNIGYVPSKESIQKTISHPNNIKNNPDIVKKVTSHPNYVCNSFEVRRKIATNPNLLSVFTKRRKKVTQTNLLTNESRTFNSIGEACRILQIGYRTLNHALSSVEALKGCLWHYTDCLDSVAKIQEQQVLVQYDVAMNPISAFQDAVEASQCTGFKKDAIRMAIHYGNTAHGFIWKLRDKDFDFRIVLIEKTNVMKTDNGRTRKVIQMSKGDSTPINIFSSAKKAAEFYGAPNGSNITQCIKGTLHTAYGYKWAYVA